MKSEAEGKNKRIGMSVYNVKGTWCAGMKRTYREKEGGGAFIGEAHIGSLAPPIKKDAVYLLLNAHLCSGRAGNFLCLSV